MAGRPRGWTVIDNDGLADGSRAIGNIVRSLDHFIEEPVKTAFSTFVTLHVEDLRAGRLPADAGRGGVSDGTRFGRQVRNGDCYVCAVLGMACKLTLGGAGRTVLSFIVPRGRLRDGIWLARAGAIGARVRCAVLAGARVGPGGGGGFLAGAGLGQLVFCGEERRYVTVVLRGGVASE